MSGAEGAVDSRPVEQGKFFVGVTYDQFSAEYISRLLNNIDDTVSAFNGKKYLSLGISWLDAMEHEKAHGIDTYFLPYFEEIDNLLNTRKSVVDINSWSALQLENVDKVFYVDKLFLVVRNGVAVIDELNRNLNSDDKSVLINSMVLPLWLSQNKNPESFNTMDDFSKLCFFWSSIGFLKEYFQSSFPEKENRIFRFDQIVNESEKNREFMSFINDEKEIVFTPEQSVDTDEIVDAIWQRWSDRERATFQEYCMKEMEQFAFYMPGHKTSIPEAEQNTLYQIPSVFNPYNLPTVHVDDLHKELGFTEQAVARESSLQKTFKTWKMEEDDSPIFRYLYRNFKPDRHLEFGTWQGTGVTYVAEECDASVWTLNLFEGEKKAAGTDAYGVSNDKELDAWADLIGIKVGEKGFHHTDAFGYIGNKYLSRDFGHRVCQIYADSKKWDISKYPEGFFDSVLVDGGHFSDVVMNDTLKALKLVRSGGLMLWHDVCPEMYEEFDYVHSVMDGIKAVWPEVHKQLKKVFWVKPSFILVGIKK